MIGQTLSHFRITAKLGEGGMGEVYRAEDTKLKREVALKILPSELAGSQERLERFQREAETLAALDHPNIVTIHSVEEAGAVRFLAMQLVEGKRLSDLIPRGGMTLERIFEIAIPLADALAAAHEKGVIHRDLKPSNIMVTDEGRVKVLDFGLAKLIWEPAAEAEASDLPTKPLTEEGRVLGTVPYMSPEQVEGKRLDHRSDLFSLGVILFEMATGERPFRGESSASLISSIMKDTPREVDALNAEIPHHLARIIRHCLEKQPRRRYQSALDVRNELADLHREESLSAAASVTPRPNPEPTKERIRWPLVAAAVAGAAIVLTSLVALWLGRSQPPTEPPTQALAEPAAAVEAQPPMIVVLPFENLGAPEDEYFADGMTEEITSRLAAVSGLRVISRTSAMQYKENRPSLKQVGEELGVDYVLDGSVRWASSSDGQGRVRITPQLIRVPDDTHLWAESYDRVIEDIFEIQSAIASSVVDQLGATLRESEWQEIGTQPTENIEAYEVYLRGQSYTYSYNEADLELSLQMFDRAVELDAAFLEAWVALCETHSTMYHLGYDRSEARRLAAKEAADKSIEIDANSPYSHKVLGSYLYLIEKDYVQAEEEIGLAQIGLPSDVQLLEMRAFIQRRRGDWEKSLANFDAAIEIDPHSYEAHYNQAYSLMYLRRYEDAQLHIDKAIDLRPDLGRPYRLKAFNIWLWKGDLEESRKVLEQMAQPPAQLLPWVWQELYEGNYEAALARLSHKTGEVFPSTTYLLTKPFLVGWLNLLEGNLEAAQRAFQESEEFLRYRLRESDDHRLHLALGLTLAALGNRQEAIREGKEAVAQYSIEEDAFEGSDTLLYLAWVYTLAGEYEAAVLELDRLLRIPSQLSVPLLRIDPRWDPIRDDPRFQALLEKYA